MQTPWLNITQAAKYAKCDRSTFRKWMAKGLRYSQIGGCTRIHTAWIDDFLEKHTVKNDLDKIADDVVKSLFKNSG